MPKLSVIIPLYNKEKYLAESLQSVLSQTLHDLELIVVDNKSTDGSRAIAEEFAAKDSRVRVVDEFEHQGASAARNKGIESALGTYVAFIDADDVIEPDTYESVVSGMEAAGAQLGLYGIDHFMEGVEGRFDPLISTCEGAGSPNSFGSDLFYDLTPSTCSKVYLRSFMNECGARFDTTLEIAEDLMLTYPLIARASCLYFEPRLLYHYRKGIGDSLTSSITTTSMSSIECFEKIYGTLKDNCDDEVMGGFYSELLKHYRWLLDIAADARVFAARFDSLKHTWIPRITPHVERLKADVVPLFERYSAAEDAADLLFVELHEARDWLWGANNDLWNRTRELEERVRELEDARGQLEKRAADIESLRGQIGELEGSTSMKVGRAVMALPCAVKDRLRSK